MKMPIKWLSGGLPPPPTHTHKLNRDFFSTSSKSPLILHTWYVAQKYLGFQGFIFFYFFLNLFCPADWLIKTSVYILSGHCRIHSFQISLIDMLGTSIWASRTNLGWFGGGGKKITFSTKNGLSETKWSLVFKRDFLDLLKITYNFSHLICCTNIARFSRF